jgi:hypothetical protein
MILRNNTEKTLFVEVERTNGQLTGGKVESGSSMIVDSSVRNIEIWGSE